MNHERSFEEYYDELTKRPELQRLMQTFSDMPDYMRKAALPFLLAMIDCMKTQPKIELSKDEIRVSGDVLKYGTDEEILTLRSVAKKIAKRIRDAEHGSGESREVEGCHDEDEQPERMGYYEADAFSGDWWNDTPMNDHTITE